MWSNGGNVGGPIMEFTYNILNVDHSVLLCQVTVHQLSNTN